MIFLYIYIKHVVFCFLLLCLLSKVLHVVAGGNITCVSNMAPVLNSMLCIHQTAMVIILDGREEKGF